VLPWHKTCNTIEICQASIYLGPDQPKVSQASEFPIKDTKQLKIRKQNSTRTHVTTGPSTNNCQSQYLRDLTSVSFLVTYKHASETEFRKSMTRKRTTPTTTSMTGQMQTMKLFMVQANTKYNMLI
jgi:hypothetical protein